MTEKEDTKYAMFGLCIVLAFTAIAIGVAIEFSPTLGAVVFAVPILWVGYNAIRRKEPRQSD